MARLMVDPEKTHPIERACERRGLSREQAAEAIRKLVQVVAEQAPDDWRFTSSPVAKFIIAYEPDGPDCRFLGRSYRDRRGAGKALCSRLSAETVSEFELGSVRAEYQKLLSASDCDILHELKTCYDRTQDESAEKRLFEGMKRLLPHVVPVEARRVARRPNALITGGELWARQGEFLDLSTGPKVYKDMLLFMRLNDKGIDRSRQRLYSLDAGGKLELVAEPAGTNVAQSAPGVQHPPNHRSQSYWMVPTYLDAVRFDLEYAKEHWGGDGEEYRLSADGMLLLSRLEALFRPFRPQQKKNS